MIKSIIMIENIKIIKMIIIIKIKCNIKQHHQNYTKIILQIKLHFNNTIIKNLLSIFKMLLNKFNLKFNKIIIISN